MRVVTGVAIYVKQVWSFTVTNQLLQPSFGPTHDITAVHQDADEVLPRQVVVLHDLHQLLIQGFRGAC